MDDIAVISIGRCSPIHWLLSNAVPYGKSTP